MNAIIISMVLVIVIPIGIRLWLWRRSTLAWRNVVRRKLVEVEDQIRILRLQVCDVEDKVDGKTGPIWDMPPDEDDPEEGVDL